MNHDLAAFTHMNLYSGFRYEPVSGAQLETLAGISRETFWNTFADSNTPEDMLAYLDTMLCTAAIVREWNLKGQKFYFGLNGTEIIGYFKLNLPGFQSDFDRTDALELERFYILSRFQGKGLGALMMQGAFREAALMGFSRLWLGVWEHNLGAIAFYRRMGFEKTGVHDFILGKDLQQDWIMEKVME